MFCVKVYKLFWAFLGFEFRSWGFFFPEVFWKVGEWGGGREETGVRVCDIVCWNRCDGYYQCAACEQGGCRGADCQVQRPVWPARAPQATVAATAAEDANITAGFQVQAGLQNISPNPSPRENTGWGTYLLLVLQLSQKNIFVLWFLSQISLCLFQGLWTYGGRCVSGKVLFHSWRGLCDVADSVTDGVHTYQAEEVAELENATGNNLNASQELLFCRGY